MQDRTFVLFDFDGVIADSFMPLFEAACAVHPHFTEANYRTIWDGNIYDAWKKLELECTDACRRDEKEFFAEFEFRKHRTTIFNGMEAVLRELAERHTLSIISSGVSMDIMAHLEKQELGRYFSDIFGKDVHFSKIQKINMLLDRYDITARDCVFVTDTLGDMREAREAGIDSIGVSWGFQPRERLERGSPFCIVDTPSQLPQAVCDYFARVTA